MINFCSRDFICQNLIPAFTGKEEKAGYFTITSLGNNARTGISLDTHSTLSGREVILKTQMVLNYKNNLIKIKKTLLKTTVKVYKSYENLTNLLKLDFSAPRYKKNH